MTHVIIVDISSPLGHVKKEYSFDTSAEANAFNLAISQFCDDDDIVAYPKQPEVRK